MSPEDYRSIERRSGKPGSFRSQMARSVELPLFDGRSMTFHGREASLALLPGMVGFDRRVNSNAVFSWIGGTYDDAGLLLGVASVTAYKEGGAWVMSSSIQLPGESKAFHLTTTAPGHGVFDEIGLQAAGVGRNADSPVSPGAVPHDAEGGPRRPPRGVGVVMSYVEVLAAIENDASDPGLRVSQIIESINVANAAFSFSDMTVRHRLIGIEQVVYDATTSDSETLINQIAALAAIRIPREAVRADLVIVVVECLYGTAARAQAIPREAVGDSTVAYAYVCPGHLGAAYAGSLAHELGHLMGSQHYYDKGEGKLHDCNAQAAFTYSCGFKDSGQARTIMAEDCIGDDPVRPTIDVCPRQWIWSSPTYDFIGFAGHPAGEIEHDVVIDGRVVRVGSNNVQSIQRMGPVVAAYRADPWEYYEVAATPTSGADVAGLGNNRFLVVASGLNGALLYSVFNATPGTATANRFGPLRTVANAAVSSAPRVSASSAGNAIIIYKGADGKARTRQFALGADSTSGTVGAARLVPSDFVIRTTPDIAHAPFDSSATNVISGVTSTIAVVATESGFGLPMYTTSADGGTTWRAWQVVDRTGGDVPSSSTAPAVVGRESSTFDIVFRDSNNHVRFAGFSTLTTTRDWVTMDLGGSPFTAAPMVAATDDDTLAVYTANAAPSLLEATVWFAPTRQVTGGNIVASIDQSTFVRVAPVGSRALPAGAIGCGASGAIVDVDPDPAGVERILEPGPLLVACANPSGEDLFRVYMRGW